MKRMLINATQPEELRVAYKILKNANCLPPEIELKKEIRNTQDLLSGMADTAEKYNTLKKLNLLIMKLNSLRSASIEFDVPQEYMGAMAERFGSNPSSGSKKENE